MDIPWDQIDAAFADNNAVYIFKDSFYISSNISDSLSFSDEPRLVFKDLYNCPLEIYNHFGGYHNYIQTSITLMSTPNNRIILNESGQDFNSHAIIILLIIISVLICCIICIVLKAKAKQGLINNLSCTQTIT